MAFNTDISLRSGIIYSIYVRSHTEEGTFRSVIPDLPRIRSLGTDIIWFMPIHPIGVKGKKGSLGCPYANRDYRTVNPCYGTMDDFTALVDAIHGLGMKCMIDVVYNHTSPDAVLVSEHPDYYYHKPDGSLGGKTADWSDVIDLDYNNPALWDYQIASLRMWAGIVDGFRCDVASFVPLEFWRKAREKVAEVNPDCIWLAESVHGSFSAQNRARGICCATDSELFSVFDMEYEYDVREVFDSYLRGEAPLSSWVSALNVQEAAYPDNYIKMRCLENHDQPRIASLVKDDLSLRNYTAMLYFLKGSTLLYAGQEYSDTHQPSLFEKETIPRREEGNISPFLQKLAEVKKNALSPKDYFQAAADDGNDLAIFVRDDGHHKKYGFFSLKGKEADVPVSLPDGEYCNLLDDLPVHVTSGILHLSGEPVMISAE